jgi:O-antigen/teichoic acid export membrane protein
MINLIKSSIKKYINIDREKIKYFIILGFEKIFILIFHFTLINFIDPDLYGLFNQINFYSSYILGITLMGVIIPLIVSYSGKKENDIDTALFSHFLISFILGLIILIIVLVFKGFFATFIFGNSSYSLFVFPFFIIVISDIFSEFIIAKKRIVNNLFSYSKFIFFRTFLRLSSLALIYYFTKSFLISLIFSSLIYLIYSLSLFNFEIKSLQTLLSEKNNILKTIKEGFKLFILYVLNTGNLAIINLFIINQFSLDILAVYNFNFFISSIPVTISSYIIFYTIPNYVVESRRSGNLDFYYKDFRLVLFILIFLFLIMFFSYDFLFQTIVKNSTFLDKKQFLLVYSLNSLIVIINFFQIPIINSKKYSLLLNINIISLSFNLIFLFLLNFSISIYLPIISGILSKILLLLLLIVKTYKNEAIRNT